MALAPLTACDLSTEPEPTLEIVLEGRAERGLALELSARLDGRPLEPAAVTFSSAPVEMAELDGTTLRLREAGALTIAARAEGVQTDTTLDVAVPPSIVFDATADGNRDVYRAALDGRDVVRLTTHGAEDADPTAAAGTVVFTSWRSGGADLWSVAAGGGTPEQLAHLATGASERQAALAPDGTRLAFVRSEGGFPRVLTAPLSGGEATSVTEGTAVAGGIEASPAWAPDGVRLALMSTAAIDADLYAVHLADTTASVLVGGEGPQVEPAWSADGASVAYVAEAEGAGGSGGDAELFHLGLETESLTRLTSREGADGQPAFLPDGRIVYTAFTDEGTELRWLDPEAPQETFAVPVELEGPENPAAVRP